MSSTLPKIGDRVRFAIHYKGAWRPLGWVRVGKDGSIYLGLLTGNPSVVRSFEKPASRVTKIKYDGAQELSKVPKSSRISFKASGEIHLGERVARNEPLESMQKPRQLCLMLFVHPSRYLPPKSKNPNDYDMGILGYEVDNLHPMYGALIVSPLGHSSVVHQPKLPNMTTFSGIALGFRGLSRTPDLLVQIVIGHGPKGPWPELPGVLVVQKDIRH